MWLPEERRDSRNGVCLKLVPGVSIPYYAKEKIEQVSRNQWFIGFANECPVSDEAHDCVCPDDWRCSQRLRL